jgi:hypothetical protein
LVVAVHALALVLLCSCGRETSTEIRSSAREDHPPAATTEEPENVREPRSPAVEKDSPRSANEIELPSGQPALLADLNIEDEGAKTADTVHGRPPTRGCAPIERKPARVWPAPGPTAMVAIDNRFVVAGYARENGTERVFAVSVSPESLPLPLNTRNLDLPMRGERSAPPGLGVRDPHHVVMAYVDGAREVYASTVPVGRSSAGGTPTRVGQNADPRFAPAVSRVGDSSLVAWTEATTPMRTHLIELDKAGRVKRAHDITPAAMGAAAPEFIDGSRPPELLVVDARDGFSPLVRIKISPDGTPGEPTVAVPLRMVSTPVEVAAARNDSVTMAAYTGIGAAATSAVGLQVIEPAADTPLALVPGTAYGRLHVAATAAAAALIFAADAPLKTGASPPHEIQLRLVDASGMGQVTLLRGPEGTASNPAVARRSDGTVGVSFQTGSGVYVVWLKCDDG